MMDAVHEEESTTKAVVPLNNAYSFPHASHQNPQHTTYTEDDGSLPKPTPIRPDHVRLSSTQNLLYQKAPITYEKTWTTPSTESSFFRPQPQKTIIESQKIDNPFILYVMDHFEHILEKLRLGTSSEEELLHNLLPVEDLTYSLRLLPKITNSVKEIYAKIVFFISSNL